MLKFVLGLRYPFVLIIACGFSPGIFAGLSLAEIEAPGLHRPKAGADYSFEPNHKLFQNLTRNLPGFDSRSHVSSRVIAKEINGYDVGLNYLYVRTLDRDNDLLGAHSFIPTLGRSVNDHWYVRLRYNYQNRDIIGGGDDGRDSGLNLAMIDNFLYFMDGQAYLSLGYQAENENSNSDEFDNFGHVFHARLKLPVPVNQLKSWDPLVNIGLQYSDKTYANVSSGIGAERQDERTTFSLGLDANLSRHVFAKFDYEYIDARSNMSASKFNENIVTFSIGVRY